MRNYWKVRQINQEHSIASPCCGKMRGMPTIAQTVQMTCVLEACAPKPGNVSRFHDFPDTSLEDYLISAIAIGPAFENAAQCSIGQTIWQAVSDTRKVVRSNTNLGMVLLLAPLAKAGAEPKDIRQSLRGVLKSLTVEDAKLAYSAIRLVKPGGLGKVNTSDVVDEPAVTLLEAMALAQERDSIAREYVSDFAISFETGLPALNAAFSRGADFSGAIVQSFLTILSTIPDTLIARKKGLASAREVTRRAGEVLALGGIFTANGKSALAQLDRDLRDPDHALNPGTTADLTAAAIFLSLVAGSAGVSPASFPSQKPNKG
jgi:triphosphoribosyl-dephospho-CoA synthase